MIWLVECVMKPATIPCFIIHINNNLHLDDMKRRMDDMMKSMGNVSDVAKIEKVIFSMKKKERYGKNHHIAL
jgi:hypothetical protein